MCVIHIKALRNKLIKSLKIILAFFIKRRIFNDKWSYINNLVHDAAEQAIVIVFVSVFFGLPTLKDNILFKVQL